MPDLAAAAAAKVATLTKEERARAEEVSRAARAKAILEDPMVVDAFATIEAEIMRGWKASTAPDLGGREMLYDLSRALALFRGYFESILTTGQMAQVQLRSVQSQKDFAARRLQMIRPTGG